MRTHFGLHMRARFASLITILVVLSFTTGEALAQRPPDRGFVPAPVADRMLDIMPSKRLVFHEYRTHGTCSGLGVDGYFDLARQLYEKIKIPRRFVGPIDERMTIAPGELVSEFMAVNP